VEYNLLSFSINTVSHHFKTSPRTTRIANHKPKLSLLALVLLELCPGVIELRDDGLLGEHLVFGAGLLVWVHSQAGATSIFFTSAKLTSWCMPQLEEDEKVLSR
jgi:hypothetical protein